MNNDKYLTPILLLVVLLLMLNGCSKQTRVILLPEDDGTVGALTVSNSQGHVDISKSGESTVVSSDLSAPEKPTQLSVKEVSKKYSELLATLPEQPDHIALYFTSSATELTDESMALFLTVPDLIKKKDSHHISVIGHSDRVGNEEYNLKLSAQRAKAIADMLIKEGANKEYITITSHGEGNPLVKTEDNVAEPKNRRVEIIVR